MNMNKAEIDLPSVSIARQPVFDHNGRLWGYDLFCIGTGNPGGSPSEPLNAAVCMASGASIHFKQILQGGKKVIVDFGNESVAEHLPYALPPMLTVIRVDEASLKADRALNMLNQLKKDGYLIAVGGFTGDPACSPAYDLADIIVISIQSRDSAALQADLAAARKYGSFLLAGQVPDRHSYELCRKLDFRLFSGPYFKHPDTMVARRLSSNEMLRFKLLQLIEQSDPDIDALAEAIQADVTISFRLLTFLNSAAFSFSQKIRSIHHAIYLLGWDKVKNWLRVILLTDMKQSRDAGELVLLSAQRGMFLQLVAQDHDFWGFDPRALYLLGLFSLLDTLLHMPMMEIINYLPIDDKIKRALCRDPENEYIPLLRMAQFFEEAQWALAESMVQQLNLQRTKVNVAFQKSIEWARGLESLQYGCAGKGEAR